MITNGSAALRGTLAAALLAAALSASAQEAAAAPAATPAPSPAAAPAPASTALPKLADATVKVGGLVHVDGRLFVDDDAGKLTDDVLLRRVRPSLQAKLGRFTGRVVADFGGGKAVVQDAFVEAALPFGLAVRVGKYTPPIGPERIQSSNATFFTELALPSNFAPSRDVGLQLTGKVGKVATFDVGLFDGAVDSGSADADVSDDKDVAARIFVKPFAPLGIALLSNLGLGVSGSYGATHGDPAKATELYAYKSDGQATILDFRKGAVPDATNTAAAQGRRTRLDLHGSWFAGPAGVVGEYAISEQRVTYAGSAVRARNTAWQATALYNVTGEAASDGSVAPAAPLDGGGWGALQVAARFASLDVDDDLFPTFADPAKYVSGATAFGVGLTWWPTRDARVMLDYCQTAFDGGAAAGADRPTEKAILSRVQVVF